MYIYILLCFLIVIVITPIISVILLYIIIMIITFHPICSHYDSHMFHFMTCWFTSDSKWVYKNCYK